MDMPNISATIEEMGSVVTEELQKYLRNVVKETQNEYRSFQQQLIKDTFNDSISSFYGAYSPKKYKRHGNTSSHTGGLYDLINLDDGRDYQFFEDDYSDIYSEANMHDGRKGYNGLFELVFVEGYHGGAKSISGSKAKVWGSHPSPGTPYWRRRGFVRALRRWHNYGKWGSAAKQTTPPKDLVIQGMDSVLPEMANEFKTMMQTNLNDGVRSFAETTLPSVLKRIGW